MTDDLPARQAMRRTLIENNIPSAFVDEIVDLAFHSADTAMKAMWDVLERASDQRVTITASGCAIGIVQTRCQILVESMAKAGAAAGMPVKVAMVRVAQ